MIQFCPIAPTQYLRPLDILSWSDTHLVLAHLMHDEEYRNCYASSAYGKTIILDNSGFEMYRLGKPMFDGNQLIDLAGRVGADYIVMPDYPGEHPLKTIAAAIEFAPQFQQAGIRTFFVPQGRPGNLDDFFMSFAWAASSPLVDYIGISILAAPIAFECDQPGNIQTFLSRVHLCRMLQERGLWKLAKDNGKLIHFLGMTDGPNEIMAAKLYQTIPDSWDSSAPVWAGIMNVKFDDSPTGLRNGKIHTHVDFDIPFDESNRPVIEHNLQYIKQLIED